MASSSKSNSEMIPSDSGPDASPLLVLETVETGTAEPLHPTYRAPPQTVKLEKSISTIKLESGASPPDKHDIKSHVALRTAKSTSAAKQKRRPTFVRTKSSSPYLDPALPSLRFLREQGQPRHDNQRVRHENWALPHHQNRSNVKIVTTSDDGQTLYVWSTTTGSDIPKYVGNVVAK